MADPHFASGTGSANEAVMDSNPTITIPAGGSFSIASYLLTYQGAGTIRLRETDINGAELCRFRCAADGQIEGGGLSPYPLGPWKAPKDAARTIVITQEGDFDCSILLS